jgi:hypothetical protein
MGVLHFSGVNVKINVFGFSRRILSKNILSKNINRDFHELML